jgi:cell division protein FtsB
MSIGPKDDNIDFRVPSRDPSPRTKGYSRVLLALLGIATLLLLVFSIIQQRQLAQVAAENERLNAQIQVLKNQADLLQKEWDACKASKTRKVP